MTEIETTGQPEAKNDPWNELRSRRRAIEADLAAQTPPPVATTTDPAQGGGPAIPDVRHEIPASSPSHAVAAEAPT